MSVTTNGGALGSTRGEGDEDSSRLAIQRYAPKPTSPPTTISTTNVTTTRRRIRLELDSASSHELPGGKSAKLLGRVSMLISPGWRTRLGGWQRCRVCWPQS